MAMISFYSCDLNWISFLYTISFDFSIQFSGLFYNIILMGLKMLDKNLIKKSRKLEIKLNTYAYSDMSSKTSIYSYFWSVWK